MITLKKRLPLMRMASRRFLSSTLLVTLLSVALPSTANENNHCGQAMTIFFGNGVWNSREDAYDSLDTVRNVYKDALAEDYPDIAFDFELAYNHNQGTVADLWEVLLQKIIEDPRVEIGKMTAEQYVNYYIST
ncbi:hypothetical protein [Ostreibacterium oceani]|uniref:Uncharacterized protein n=1 Tax=Ostreibacterium oceani TaxID=2654998 RepID=A0A6N7EVH3_9GAMM|nr:hypothetical protein [Ostreibacterium oceani]MPV85429.1 hypothetical protein [Ostreibacterium oceani]